MKRIAWSWHWSLWVFRREDVRAWDRGPHGRPGGRERQRALWGCVLTSVVCLWFYSESKPSHMDFLLSSFRQAHHVCVRGQQEECWGVCSSSTGSPTVSRTSTTPYQRPTKERQGLWTRDVEENPSCCILFSFHFKPSSVSERPHHLSGVDPHLSLGLCSPRGTSPLAAWGEKRGRRGDRSSSEGRSLPSHRHLIQSQHHWPSNAKGAGERLWSDRHISTHFPQKLYLLSFCSLQNKLFQLTSHFWSLICPESHIQKHLTIVRYTKSQMESWSVSIN